MFSKRSVIGQPTSTPTEYGVIPAAFTVSRTLLSSSHVLGGLTPASSKVETLYQMVDLLAPLNMTPYWVPSTWPAAATSSPKASTTLSFRSSSGLIAFFFAKSAIRPGCPPAAIVGGLPPSTAVERMVARLSPPDVYLTSTFGYLSLKPLMTCWNDCCSSPAQIAMTETEPETSSFPLAPPPPLSPPPPQPAAAKASTAASAAKTVPYLIPWAPSVCFDLAIDPLAAFDVEQVHAVRVDGDVDRVAVLDP